MADRTRSSATSSRRPFWGCDRLRVQNDGTVNGLFIQRRTNAAAQLGVRLSRGQIHLRGVAQIYPQRNGARSGALAAIRRAWAARGAAAGRARRSGRRGRGHHGYHGRIWQSAGGRTLYSHRRHCGRHAGAFRQRCAKTGMVAQDRRRRGDLRFCFCRAAGALQSRRSAHDREEAGQRLCAERPQSRRDRRTLGGRFAGDRAHGRRHARCQRCRCVPR